MYLIPQPLVDALDGEIVRPIHFVFIDWPGGAVYAHDGIGEIHYDGHTWIGISGIAEIGGVTHDSNIGAHTINLGLSGIDPKGLSEVVTRNVIGRDVEVHLGAVAEDGSLVGAVPYFQGRISSTNIKRYGGDSIVVQATSKTADWDKNRPNRYTDASYRADFPDDDFLQYIDLMADRALYWNSDKESTPLVPRR